MPLFRCKRSVHWYYVFPMPVNDRSLLEADPRRVEPGDLIDFEPHYSFLDYQFGRKWRASSEDFERLHDPRERDIPNTRADLEAECDWLHEWIRAKQIPWFERLPELTNANGVVKKRLEQLIDAAVELGMTDLPDVSDLTERKALVVL